MDPIDLNPFLVAMKQEVYKRNSLDQPHAAAAAPAYRPIFAPAQYAEFDEWEREDWASNGEDFEDDWSYGDVLPGSHEYFYPGRPQSAKPDCN